MAGSIRDRRGVTDKSGGMAGSIRDRRGVTDKSGGMAGSIRDRRGVTDKSGGMAESIKEKGSQHARKTEVIVCTREVGVEADNLIRRNIDRNKLRQKNPIRYMTFSKVWK